MTSIPPELLEAICSEITDIESLKSCSLAASALRYPCQRILLSSLTLKVQNHASVCKLLAESSHIAEYVVSLTILLAMQHLMTSEDLESLYGILGKLHRVRRCILDGSSFRSLYSAVARSSPVPPVLLEFFARQPLRELRLNRIEISSNQFSRLVTVAPALHFQILSLQEESDDVPIDSVPPSPFLHSVFINCSRTEQFLVLPQNISCLTRLRHLSIRTGRCTEMLIEVAAQILEHLQFDYRSFTTFPTMFPRLPALRTVQFVLPDLMVNATAHLLTAVVNSLSGLAMNPGLAVVGIKCSSTKIGAFDVEWCASLMARLDEAVATYAMAPCIHWVLTVYGGDKNLQARLAHFTDSVRCGMPKAHNAGRLMLEANGPARTVGRIDGSRYTPFGHLNSDGPRYTLQRCTHRHVDIF
ncbi:hypothetical protein C8R45DRAFT_614192 [Mycena sanguinolenta]|nr:hypothetical protein C8R45DRAFT_614192 [Mycena sanguinolenta]